MIETYYNSEKLSFKAGDVPKPLELKIIDELTSEGISLTGCSSVFALLDVTDEGQASNLFTPRACTIDEVESTVTFTWQTGDLASAGRFYGLFLVTFPDSSVMSFPQEGYLNVDVESLAS